MGRRRDYLKSAPERRPTGAKGGQLQEDDHGFHGWHGWRQVPAITKIPREAGRRSSNGGRRRRLAQSTSTRAAIRRGRQHIACRRLVHAPNRRWDNWKPCRSDERGKFPTLNWKFRERSQGNWSARLAGRQWRSCPQGRESGLVSWKRPASGRCRAMTLAGNKFPRTDGVESQRK